jgi:hypothetical protein
VAPLSWPWIWHTRAHRANFGVFASPERALVFDINDFDETLTGPFEWDVKRLTASFVVAAGKPVQCLAEPDRRTRSCCSMSPSDGTICWTGTSCDLVHPADGRRHHRHIGQPETAEERAVLIVKARSNTSMRTFEKLTTNVDGRRSILDDPPLIERMPPEEVGKDIGSRLSKAF